MIRVYPSGGDVTTAWEAITPPAPGRFSTTTDWPHCLDTTSPRVRVSTSTPPPAGYGTRMWTDLDGKDCADAAPVAAHSNAAAAVSRNQLPIQPSRTSRYLT